MRLRKRAGLTPDVSTFRGSGPLPRALRSALMRCRWRLLEHVLTTAGRIHGT